MSNIKDLAIGTVATAPSPQSSGTSLVVSAGNGIRYPATPFFATAFPPNQLPSPDTAEIIEVTNVSTDTLTIVRAQKSTAARNIDVGWIISNAIYADDIAEVGNNSLITKEVPAGSVNGVNTTFTLSQSYIGDSLQVYVNGVAQSEYVTETTPASGIFNLDEAPLTGDSVIAAYQHVDSVTGNSDTVDGYHANATPTANTIPVLDGSGKMPVATLDALKTLINAGVVNPKFMQIGTVATPAVTGFQSAAVTFGTVFNNAPHVFVTANSASSAITNTQVGGSSTTGVTVYMNQTASTARSVYWVAIDITQPVLAI